MYMLYSIRWKLLSNGSVRVCLYVAYMYITEITILPTCSCSAYAALQLLYIMCGVFVIILQVKELTCDTYKTRFMLKELPRGKAVVQSIFLVCYIYF